MMRSLLSWHLGITESHWHLLCVKTNQKCTLTEPTALRRLAIVPSKISCSWLWFITALPPLENITNMNKAHLLQEEERVRERTGGHSCCFSWGRRGLFYWARICKRLRGRFRQPILPGRPVHQTRLPYRPARLHRLAESIPGLLRRLQIRSLYYVIPSANSINFSNCYSYFHVLVWYVLIPMPGRSIVLQMILLL